MKIKANVLLFILIAFLTTPTIVSVIKKSSDISVFYSFSEEEKAHKEFKAVFNTDALITHTNLSLLNSGLIHSENLSKHNKISSKIFIPPPKQL
jgi:hypothetical protein